MKKYCSLIIGTVWLAVGMVDAAPWEPGLVAKIHFAGGDAVAADPNSIPLRSIWVTPEALALRTQTLNKLSYFLDDWLRQAIAPNLATPLQTSPLLADLCFSEWQLEVRQPAGKAVSFSLGVRLDNTRAGAWQAALNPLVAAWKAAASTHHGSVIHQGDWLYFGLDNSPAPSAGRPIPSLNHTWLDAEVDWARIAVWFPAVAKFDIPQTQLQVSASSGNFVAAGRLFLSQPLPPLEPWHFPTNVVHSPFISFTAARGVSDWLRQQPWAVSLGIDPLPNQVFTWVLPQLPFLTYVAAPLPNAPATDELLARSADPNYRNVHVDSTNSQISLVGLPFMAPFLEARKEAGGQFLVGGFLPVDPRGKTAPPELFARLNQPNLVFYHWEITAERLQVFPQLYQLALLVTEHRELEPGSAADNWLKHLGSTLGPTVTTATEVSPTELAFSRRAPAGLTALELIALGSWLEAPDFPGCDLRLPPTHRHPPHHPVPGSPAPLSQHP